MKNLSRFDLAMIIAFVVVAVLGAAGWWYLSGELQTAQLDAASAASDFDKYTKKEVYLPTKTNLRTLQNNIDLMTAQLDPLVKSRLQSAQNGLSGVHQIDTVDWKHDLDEEVARLSALATTQGINVPKNFYYGFSRYLNANPAEEATAVLKRQQIAIEAVSTILINAPVRAIIRIQRTAEEDSDSGAGGMNTMRTARSGEGDIMPGHSVEASGGVYTAYPFTFEFDTDTESFRTVVNKLMQSDYVFIIRSLQVQSSKLTSPKVNALDQMAGLSDTASVVNSAPGAVAAASQSSTLGLQYLFGDETLHVRVRIDLIDWHGVAEPTTPGTTANGRRPNGGTHGRNNNGPGSSAPGANNPPASNGAPGVTR